MRSDGGADLKQKRFTLGAGLGCLAGTKILVQFTKGSSTWLVCYSERRRKPGARVRKGSDVLKRRLLKRGWGDEQSRQ